MTFLTSSVFFLGGILRLTERGYEVEKGKVWVRWQKGASGRRAKRTGPAVLGRRVADCLRAVESLLGNAVMQSLLECERRREFFGICRPRPARKSRLGRAAF